MQVTISSFVNRALRIAPVCGLIIWSACSSSLSTIDDGARKEPNSSHVQERIVYGKTIGPYSIAKRAGDFIFLSGQIGVNPATDSLENKDIESETRQALTNMMSVLHAMGCDSNDVVSVTVYLTDMSNFSRMNTVYASFFNKDSYPTRSTVQVSALPKNARIEIAVTAYQPLHRQ